MKRRNALKTISLGVGVTVTAGSFATLLHSCKSEPTDTWLPAFFQDGDVKIVHQILDQLLPTTDSPGAGDLNIVRVLDNTVNKLYKEKDQVDFRDGLAAISSRIEKMKSDSDDVYTSFMEKYMGVRSDEEKEKFNTLINKERDEVGQDQMDDYLFSKAIYNIRQMGINSYFQSEVIGTEHLSYDPIPGEYSGCVPLSDIGNSWSL